MVIQALLWLGFAKAQDVAPLQRLPFTSWVETPTPDGKQVVSPPKDRTIAGDYRLSGDNPTSEVTDAYRYRGNIVVFGWAGHYNGMVTVIDAATGKEKLELLVNERSRLITPNGALIYAHWHVGGEFERDDSIWLLDLNHPFPWPKPHLPLDAAEELGFRIYPSAQDPKGRHNLGEMAPSEDGRDIFFADRPIVAGQPQKVCFVAIHVADLNRVTDKHNCVEEKMLTGYSPEEIRGASLAFSTPGVLQYAVSVAGEPSKAEFTVDTVTLVPSRVIPKSSGAQKNESGPPAVRMPWKVKKQSFTGGDPIDLKEPVFVGHERDRIAVNLVIDESGKVMEANVLGNTAEVRQRLEAVLRGWSSKPTILNGHATNVRLQFETSLEDLAGTALEQPHE